MNKRTVVYRLMFPRRHLDEFLDYFDVDVWGGYWWNGKRGFVIFEWIAYPDLSRKQRKRAEFRLESAAHSWNGLLTRSRTTVLLWPSPNLLHEMSDEPL